MNTVRGVLLLVGLVAGLGASPGVLSAEDLPPLKVLFLGDRAGHQPEARFRILQPVLAERKIHLTYTEQVADLNAETLAKYDGLVIYANHTDWAPENEKALLDYVASGKGFIPIHCASYCFIRSQPYIDLVGAQFRSHTTGVFRVKNVQPQHPIMQGFESFASWDETYLHHKHNPKDRTVLEVRTDGGVDEPWTWVRTHGQGRVFYTAWGHDHRTWIHPGFQNLVERGIRWACGQAPSLAGPHVDRPAMTAFAADAKRFEFQEGKLPFYPAGERWGTTREPIKEVQKPLAPAESIKHYVTPVDFAIRPFVTEESLGGGKPIAMTWDERGRLWLALTFDYPNELRSEGEGRDKIVVCADTTGDGVADSITEFADKLSIPTSMLNAHGGLIVYQAPHTLFLKDTDGDGRADHRQVLFTGWGTNDTHAGPSNLRYGFDHWIYGMCGYSGFNGTVNNEAVKFGQGLHRFRIEKSPTGELAVTKLEFLRSTNNNAWGVAFNEAGELFGSTANGCPLVHLAIPNRYFEKVRGVTPGALPNIALDNHIEPVVENYRQVDWHGGFTAGAGCSIYTARTYPREYWNRVAFVSEPTAHLTAAFVLQPHGSDYVARYGWNLLAGRDDWQAPIDAQVGPDGHMWVIDWYNVVVQHNPTPQGFRTGKGNAYETPLRDKKFGRVYRLEYTKAAPAERIDLSKASPEQLVGMLKHPNMTWRLHAQRLLIERGQADVAPTLVKLLQDEATDETGLNAGALHALWTLQGLNSLVSADQQNHVHDALKHPSPAVRRAGALIAANAAFDPRLLDDKDPRVVLAALKAAMEWDPKDAEHVGLELANVARLTAADDRQVQQAYRLAVQVHAEPVLRAVLTRPAADVPGWDALLEQVARAYAQPAPASVGTLFELLAESDTPAVPAIIAGLASGWPANKSVTLNQATTKSIATLMDKSPAASRGPLLKLARSVGVPGLDAQLAEITRGLLAGVVDTKRSDRARLEAARQVLEYQPDDDNAVSKLIAATEGASPELATGIFEALRTSQAKGIGPAILGRLKSLPPTARPVALQVLLARPESVKAFLNAVEAGQVRFDTLALDQRVALSSHPDRTIADRAKKLLAMGGGLPDPDRQKVIESLKPILSQTGDVALGKAAFTQHCAKCHKHSGEGQQIGPDLTGFAVHPKEEILIHVLDPSRSVEGNYKAYTASLLDGRVVTGLLSSETRTSIELLDAENKRHAISRDDLEELKESVKSLMPEGFEKTMKTEELTNLLEFLTQKGKYVPIPLDRYATAVSTKGMFYSESADLERLVFPDWAPKEFKGVPFYLVDPQESKAKNVILLHGPNGRIPPTMPKSVVLPCNSPAKAIHLLGGIGGWNYPASERGSTSLIVRLHYADGSKEEHELKNGIHIADYIRRVDVPRSEFAFKMKGPQQVRYLAITPKKADPIQTIELLKGPDSSAPVVVAVTVETP